MTNFTCNACLNRKEISYDAKPWDDEDHPELSLIADTPCPACTGSASISAPVGTIIYLAYEYFHEIDLDYQERSRLSSLFDAALQGNDVRVTIKATPEMVEAWEAFLEDSSHD